MKLISLEAITRALNEGGVRFIVVGGLAVNAHGYGRMTQDLDLVVPLDEATIKAIFELLASLGYRPIVPISAQQFADRHQRERWIAEKGMTVLSFHSDEHRETPVDLFATVPFEFDEEYELSLIEEVAPDVPIRIVRYPTLLRMKLDAGRAQDLADIEELRLLQENPRDE
jgi:hypothetical protein